MGTFIDDDPGYLAWVAENPEGYVLNIQRGLSASDARVHSASCRTISGSPRAAAAGPGPYMKVCSVFGTRELDDWAAARSGSRRSGAARTASRSTRSHRARDAGGAPPDLRSSSRVIRAPVRSTRGRLTGSRSAPGARCASCAQELRAASGSAAPGAGEILSASYGSPVPEFCDTENVLIYNVGTGAFDGGRGRGVAARATRQLPVRHPNRSEETRCTTSATRQQTAMRTSSRGASRTPQPSGPGSHRVPRLTEATKPAAVWLAMSHAEIKVHEHLDRRSYGLRLVLGVPTSTPLAPAKVLKPLVDGVIASLHAHDGSTWAAAHHAARRRRQARTRSALAQPDDG